MSARVFISHRSPDGRPPAEALARALGAVFGAQQVMLGRDDARGLAAWREALGGAQQARPLLLLLLTPGLVEALGPDGRLRIADPADAVRREFELAMEAGAHVIPLLCDTLSRPPDASKLPEPFHRIGGLPWRRLRAADWDEDVARLVADLRAQGLQARPPAPAVTPQAASDAPEPVTRPRSPALIAAAAAVAALAGGFTAVAWHRGTTLDPLLQAEPPAAGFGSR